MFQLVVGELQSILGHLEEEESFESMVFTSWLAQTRFLRDKEFAALEGKLTEALSTYQSAKVLDEELFGQELEVV